MNNTSSISPISAVYQETTDSLELNTHFHNSYEIIYVVGGDAQFSINNRSYKVSSNSLLFISNLETHHLKVTGYPYIRYFILIKPEYFQSIINEPVLASIFKHRPGHFRHVIELKSEDKPNVDKIIKSIYEECTTNGDFRELSVKSDLCLLLVYLFRNYRGFFPLTSLSESEHAVLEIQRYIEEHYMETISLQELSKLFFIDMYYLSHLFRKVTGFSFKEYLILQRISKSRDYLFCTNDDITTVALNSGFNNVNHFIRIFKKFEGITPYQYRKNLR